MPSSSTPTSPRIRPFLKWAGNKYQALKHVLPRLPEGKRFIEPFAGSGAIFLNTDYEQYVLMDVNHDLIDLYQFLQAEGQTFIEYCEQYFTKKHNVETRYYQLRDRFNAIDKQQHERAALFLYLNRHGYNGLCRYNSSGGFNVPFGRHTKPYFPQREMQHFYQKSQQATFICDNFLTVNPTFFKKGDVCYCDPPYIPLSSSAKFTQYAQTDFTETDQRTLAQRAETLRKRGVQVLISNHDTALARELYEQADIHSFPVARSISRDRDGRKPVQELIAIYD